MNYAKKVISRRRKHRLVTLSPADLNRDCKLVLRHIKPSPEGLRSGGSWQKKFTESGDIGKLFCAGERLFCYLPAKKVLHDLSRGKECAAEECPRAFAPGEGSATEGEADWFLFDDKTGYFGGAGFVTREGQGGDAGVFFHDRLCFVGDGKFHYTADYEDVAKAEYGVNGSGTVSVFRPDCGKLLAVAPLDGKLYLFHERGIDEYVMRHDTYAHEMRPLPYRGGKIAAGSVRWTEEAIVFLTEEGLCTFDGKEISVEDPRLVKEIALTDPPECHMWGKKYCLYGEGTGMSKVLYGYDLESRLPFLLEGVAETFAASSDLYFASGTSIFKVTSKGVSPVRGRCILECTLDLPDGVRLESVSFEGSGAAEIVASNRVGAEGFSIEAGESRPLCRPIGGRVALTATFRSGDFLFKSYTLGFSKEDV